MKINVAIIIYIVENPQVMLRFLDKLTLMGMGVVQIDPINLDIWLPHRIFHTSPL